MVDVPAIVVVLEFMLIQKNLQFENEQSRYFVFTRSLTATAGK